MQVDIHWVAAERAQEETGRLRSTAPRQHPPGKCRPPKPSPSAPGYRKDIDGRDRFAEFADHRGFVLTGALAEMRFNSRCSSMSISICGSGEGIGSDRTATR